MRMPLAQLDPNAVAAGLATNPLAWLLTMSMLTIAMLSREVLGAKNAAIQAANDATRAEVARSQIELDARMAMLEKLLPLADRLVDGIRACERIVDKVGPR